MKTTSKQNEAKEDGLPDHLRNDVPFHKGINEALVFAKCISLQILFRWRLIGKSKSHQHLEVDKDPNDLVKPQGGVAQENASNRKIRHCRNNHCEVKLQIFP